MGVALIFLFILEESYLLILELDIFDFLELVLILEALIHTKLKIS